MTREEALSKVKGYLTDLLPSEEYDEVEKIIEALEQKSCEDAINRIFKRMWNCRGKHTTSIDKVKMEQIILEELPSVLPTQNWIPVSERLPETNGRYLAYIVNEHDDKLKYIMTCEYVVDSYWHWFPDDECASDNVIAWMPLPEPYKAESEG